MALTPVFDSVTATEIIGGVTANGSTSSRTLAAWFGDSANVKAFGVKGDGTTDDTAALQAALNAGAGGAVYFPNGTYIISGTLLISAGTTVFGNGVSSLIKANPAWVPTTISGPNGSGISATMMANENWNATSITDTDIVIRDMAFDYGAFTWAGLRQCVMMRMVRRFSGRNNVFFAVGKGFSCLACDDVEYDHNHILNAAGGALEAWESPTIAGSPTTSSTSTRLAQGVTRQGSSSLAVPRRQAFRAMRPA
jgi:hypothetical protein